MFYLSPSSVENRTVSIECLEISESENVRIYVIPCSLRGFADFGPDMRTDVCAGDANSNWERIIRFSYWLVEESTSWSAATMLRQSKAFNHAESIGTVLQGSHIWTPV